MNWLRLNILLILFSASLIKAQDSLTIPTGLNVGRINTSEVLPSGISVTDLRTLKDQGSLFMFYPYFIDEKGQNTQLTHQEFDQLTVEVIREPRVGFNLEKDPIKKSINIGLEPYFCECFTSIGPDSAVYSLSVPSSTNTREIELTAILLTNIQDVSIWVKCRGFFLYTILTLLIVAYIIGIIRKPRFAPNAYIRYSRNSYLAAGRGKKYVLLTNFFNRWLVPYIPEKRMVQGVLFEAGNSKSHVYLSKKSQKKSMRVANNEILNPGKRRIKILNKQYVEMEAGNSRILHEYNQR